MEPALILADEWIGLKVEVVESPNPSEVGLKGIVVDETMNTLRIKTEKSLKTVAKRGRVFRVWYKGRVLRVKGDLIAFRPEERIKRGIMLIKRAKR
ncbi:ribonuclease P component 1 family protein [Archaeoglobus veneficus]|uniref:Ribonuclease P protein component 1 n=1 Tax=Archaeoglobus veneficus (strain DSM 11195 / SNP6) TaxID=693661 RepID=F2KSU3_ARCVS|nr:ribonuclease P protein subunit [Archaeoglobus veneficus]AEA46988.1 Ribonuclease P protein component 1 [Archaeoglobus veneficus SNP6]